MVDGENSGLIEMRQEVAGVEVMADESVFLIGRPPLAEFLGYVIYNSEGGQQADQRALVEQWGHANDHIQQLTAAEAGIADGVPVLDLPAEMRNLEIELRADSIFQEAYRLLPVVIGYVELDRLVVFQKHINLRFVRDLLQSLGPNPSPEAVFRFALPYDHPTPTVRMAQAGQNQFVFSSPSTDFRFLGARLLGVDQISDFRPDGRVANVIGLMLGHGSNFLNAHAVENRLILNNGSHRAYVLREMGQTHAPCVIQQVARPDELQLVTSPEVFNNRDRYLADPRPPILRDYFDPLLRVVLPVPRKLRQIRVQFGVEQIDVPAG